MLAISVGTTTSGRNILIKLNATSIQELVGVFEHFSERDRFDTLLAIEYLLLGEKRRGCRDETWVRDLISNRDMLNFTLGRRMIASWKHHLGIASAFAARDYGRTIVHTHFRKI